MKQQAYLSVLMYGRVGNGSKDGGVYFMTRSQKIVVFGMVVIGLVVSRYLWLNPIRTMAGSPTRSAPRLPDNSFANGPYSVKGNMIVGADGQQYIIHGIGRDGLEYNCSGQGPLDLSHLAYMGAGPSGVPGTTYWGANTVRLPLSEGFWLRGAPGYPCTALQYQTLVKNTVNILTALRLNVILDLQWTDANRQSGQGGGPWAMPDADSVLFWQQIAPIYKSYTNVLFEVYNEPHPAWWSCWVARCTMFNDRGYSDDCRCSKTFTYLSVGMQALVTTIRNAGATNLILVGGMNWGYNLSEIAVYPIIGSNIVYDTHPYPYTGKLPNTWDASFGTISATYPVISAESGEYDCGTSYMSQLLAYDDAHQIGWVAWAWVVKGNTCSYPMLITDYQGTPSASMGELIYQHLQSYRSMIGSVKPIPIRKGG